MILNTRPSVHREAFDAAFSGFGLPLLFCPMLAVNNLRPDYPDPALFDALIFTSQIGVGLFPAHPVWHGKEVYTVGEATAAVARFSGFCNIVCTGQDAADLSAHIASAPFKRALYPSAHTVAADLAVQFPERVTRIATYQAVPTPYLRESVLHRLRAGQAAFVPLFSKRTARAFNTALRHAKLDAHSADITAIGISAAVLQVEQPRWGNAYAAAEATSASIASTLAHVLRQRPSCAA